MNDFLNESNFLPIMKALVLLSGGLNSRYVVNNSTAIRCDKVVEIHDQYDYVICSSGTTYRKDGSHPPYSEAEGMKRYLMERGVPVSKIILEETSKDTFSNAYYCRFLCLDPLKIVEFDVLTNKFHLERTQYLFDLVCPAPDYTIDFVAAENPIVSPEILHNRLRHEKTILLFYKKYLLSIYGIIPGDMIALKQFMEKYNHAMTGCKDEYHEELTKDITAVINNRIDSLY